MEHYYTAYTKTINNTPYYFVKKYSRFTELQNAPAILESYGMHVDFNSACNIAAIHDVEIKYNFLKKLHRVWFMGNICLPLLPGRYFQKT